jgi:RNA polymerase sigma-70 factor (ECF subfamily)
MNDIALWQQLKDGNKAALQNIYQQHIKMLLQYGKKISKDEQLVEDCAQDLFIELWKKRTTIGMTDSIAKYLVISLKRKIIRQISAKQKKYSSNEPEEHQFDGEFAIEDQLINAERSAEQSAKLKAALSSLSKRQQEALYLKYHADMDYKEIGEVMDINYQSVRNLVFNALQALRKGMILLIFWCFGIFAL